MGYVDSDTAAKPLGIALYERASKAGRYLLDNIRVAKGAHGAAVVAAAGYRIKDNIHTASGEWRLGIL